MQHYVSLFTERKADILHFGGFVPADGYFGVSTFVNPVVTLGIEVISCLKSNAALHYPPPSPAGGKKGKGRPRVKGDKIHWADLDEERLPLIYQDPEKKVRTGKVWVKCLKRIVRLVSVEYLRADGSVQSHKLYFFRSP